MTIVSNIWGLLFCYLLSLSFTKNVIKSSTGDEAYWLQFLQKMKSGTLLDDLKMLNKYGLLRTNLHSKLNAQNSELELNEIDEKPKSNITYLHFYNPRELKFYFTDNAIHPLETPIVSTILPAVIQNDTEINKFTIGGEVVIGDVVGDQIKSQLKEEVNQNNSWSEIISEEESDFKPMTLKILSPLPQENEKIQSDIPYPVWINKNSKKKIYNKIKRFDLKKENPRKPIPISYRKSPPKVKTNLITILKRIKSNAKSFVTKIKHKISSYPLSNPKLPRKFIFESIALLVSVAAIFLLQI